MGPSSALIRVLSVDVGKLSILAKTLGGQRYPLPPYEFMWMCGGKRGSGPEGADDLCLASLKFHGWDLSLEAGI